MWWEQNRRRGSGKPSSPEELVAEQPVPDVVPVVQPAVVPVEAVDADVVEEAAGADQFDVAFDD
ncbi:hypothetical protein GCM10023238_03180 [Streptomyces heliomycini]